jgi:hypothetical protein
MKKTENIIGLKPCPKCFRMPIIVKLQPCHWRVACPWLDCEQVNAIATTEEEAVRKWNEREVVIG